MNAFAECQEQKDRVKACYGDWFQKLWGGSYDRHSCEQETEDYRQCVQDAMKRNKNKGKRKLNNTENDWMDEVKDKSNEAADEAKGRARNVRDRAYEAADEAKGRARNARDRARDGKEEAESKLKSTASNVTSKVQETADSWAGKIKGFAKKADNKAQHNYDDDDE